MKDEDALMRLDELAEVLPSRFSHFFILPEP
jgi:hypothetical protein